MFLVAFYFKSDKLTDISYAVSFIALALYSLIEAKTDSSRVIISALLVIFWGARIGSFLLYRVMKAGSDKRFDGMRENFTRFGKFWLGQALMVWLLMIPITMSARTDRPLDLIVWLGILIWLFGFAIEAAADYQKQIFKSREKNVHPWIDEGLWHYSRHPNYFGEIAIWCGVYLSCINSLSGFDKIIGLISPIFLFLMLRFVSGVPILERSADKRWGQDPAYKDYKSSSNLLLPFK
jgi:steroid 5-alpha reductase family enzyme